MDHSRSAKGEPRARSAKAPQEDAPVDVAVLGAGVVGLCTAYALARRGLRVALVERAGEPGRGTSFANGAQLSFAYTDALAQPSLWRKLPGMLAGLDPDNLPESDPSKMNFADLSDSKKAWRDIWGCGQGIGAVDAVVPAAKLVEKLAAQYAAAKARIAG